MRLLQIILGLLGAMVCASYPALAQHASQNDPVHHRRRVRANSKRAQLLRPRPREIPAVGLAIQQDGHIVMILRTEWPMNLRLQF